jgi:hypothetical protein
MGGLMRGKDDQRLAAHAEVHDWAILLAPMIQMKPLETLGELVNVANHRCWLGSWWKRTLPSSAKITFKKPCNNGPDEGDAQRALILQQHGKQRHERDTRAKANTLRHASTWEMSRGCCVLLPEHISLPH